MLDLVHADAATLRKQFSVVLEKTVLELRGTSCLDVDDAPAANQQIMCSRIFGAPVTELAELTEVVSQFASRVAEKVRHQQQRRRRRACLHHHEPVPQARPPAQPERDAAAGAPDGRHAAAHRRGGARAARACTGPASTT